eukprot:TRINITY_DN21532_c0_g1_i1.p1 TRINITY_DN21532_c0_g1~~TRINITY_DN21532_c0_g1_i1.p1  ORF type:complete len:500 (+),score=95.99 TRINITY_DN21532_c0_g1_i1:38-1501(+)
MPLACMLPPTESLSRHSSRPGTTGSMLPPMSSRSSSSYRGRRPDTMGTTSRSISRRQNMQLQLEKCVRHLQKLWEDFCVPDWHRQLYFDRYCTGEYRPEVLIREIKALKARSALVQKVQGAIHYREDVMVRLTVLRTAYEDEDFLEQGSIPRRHLFEQLYCLRLATLNAVEVIHSWRLSVAPNPGKYLLSTQAAIAGPGSRGAAWPYAGPAGPLDEDDGTLAEGEEPEDFFFHVSRDDSVVRSFCGVLEIASECDPFLFHGSVGGAGPYDAGKLCPPPTDAIEVGRLENARLKLLEQEMAFTLFQPPFKQGGSISESLPGMSSYVKAMTAPRDHARSTEIPPEGSIHEEGSSEFFTDDRRHALADDQDMPLLADLLALEQNDHLNRQSLISAPVAPPVAAPKQEARRTFIRSSIRPPKFRSSMRPPVRSTLRPTVKAQSDGKDLYSEQGAVEANEELMDDMTRQPTDTSAKVFEGLSKAFHLSASAD